jgi:insulysin
MILKFYKYCLVFITYFSALLIGEEFSYKVVEDHSVVPILTPSLAERQTLKLRLNNGLEAYLISDPESNQAGAVLTVGAGSWDDPEEYPGIAHFLEHMLFLGTEKYPIESDYDHFIHLNNGQSNAFTTTDYTLYLFSINPPAFDEALDRFSFFFKKPLFNPSGVERELHSIDQEYAKDFNQDGFREYYVQKELANVQHPFHRFSVGNSKTLGKVTQKVLKQWYQDHYSAHKMRLIVYGPQSLETLRSWVVEDFKDVPSNWQQNNSDDSPALAEQMQGKIVYIQPLKNTRALHITWELPSSQTSFRPEHLMSAIFENDEEGSLIDNLRQEGLAENLSSNASSLGKHHLLFTLDINLTEKGLENVYLVMEQTFQALKSLQQQDLPPYLFEEFKKIQMINYQFQSRKNAFSYLMNLGESLIYEDFESFPESLLIPQTFNQNSVRQVLSYLTPQRAHFTVLSPSPNFKFDQTEQWLEVPYKVVPLSVEKLEGLINLPPYPQYRLPKPNPFIPRDLKLVNSFPSMQPSKEVFPQPLLLVNNEQAKIYFAADRYFLHPQTMWFFEIKTPAVDMSNPSTLALADLYVQSLEEVLQPYSYQARAANLAYRITRTSEGILISLSGYPDNIETFFNILIERLKNCYPSEQLFQNLKDSFVWQSADFNQEDPLEKGYKFYRNILHESSTSNQQRATTLKNVSYEAFLQYIDHLFDQTYTQGLFYGNVSQEKGLQMWKKLQTQLASHVYPYEKKFVDRVLDLPNQKGPFQIDLQVQSPANGLILGIEYPFYSYKNHAAQQILAQAMQSAFYAELRTRQQTCYLIYSHPEEFDKHLFSFFAVQTTTHDPKDLLARFETFIQSFLENMEKKELTKEQFEQIKDSFLSELEHPSENLMDTGLLLKSLAFEHEGDFDSINKSIQGFKELTYEDFLEFAKDFLGKQNKRRLALLIRGTSDPYLQAHSTSNLQNMSELANE